MTTRAASRRRRQGPGRARLHPGAAPRNVGVLQLRDLLLDHLDPGRLHHLLQDRAGLRRPVGAHPRLADRRASWCSRSRWPWPRSARATRPPAASTSGPGGWPRRNKRQWAWFVGWFNFMGEVAVTAAIDFGCAIDLDGLRQPDGLGRRGHPGEDLRSPSWSSSSLHALLNTFGVKLVGPAVQHLRLVARRRRADHRRGAVDPAREAPVGVLDADRIPQRDRLDLPAVRVPDGPADGAVHLHRLRRLGPRRPRRPRTPPGAAPARHRDERAGVADRRLHPALLDHRRRSRTGRRRA